MCRISVVIVVNDLTQTMHNKTVWNLFEKVKLQLPDELIISHDDEYYFDSTAEIMICTK